ncbi:MAG: hypothetical protein HQK97_07790, partial [Nitrospirae bacterium]|nr:hypothetical protein [Nitrospirota bacterium]
ELKKWLKKLGNLEITIYHLLSKSQTGTLSRDEIKKAIPSSLTHCITEILLVLKYSGLIDGTDMSTPKIAGDIFREWFMENCPQEDIILNGQDAMIKSTQIILEAINNSALRDDKKAEVKKILDGEINNIQSAGSEDTVNKRSLKTSLETALSLLKTTDVSITTMTNLSKHVESLGQFLGDTFNWWL